MKKSLSRIIAAAAASALLLSGCARVPDPPEFDPDSSDVKITLSELCGENTEEAVLRDHENFYVIVNRLNSRYNEFGYFRNNDMFFYEYFKPDTRAHNADLYYSGGRWYMDYSEEGTPDLEYRWYAMSDDEMRSVILSEDTLEFFDPATAEKERLYEITTNEKGEAYAYTTESREALKAVMEKLSLSGMQFNGARYDHRYIFDKETGDLINRSDYISLASGVHYRLYDTETLYDVNEPDFMHMVMSATDNALNDEEAEKVTLTAVYDDGQTFTIQYNGTYKVSLVPKAGYTAYTNAQKTAPFEGFFPYEDTTVYLFKE